MWAATSYSAWFIHSSPRCEAFYYSIQWGRFSLYCHESAAWLQLLFLIKAIGSGIIWSCPVNSWLRAARRCLFGRVRFNIWNSLGCRLSRALLLYTKCNLPAIRTDTTVYCLTGLPHSTQLMVCKTVTDSGRPSQDGQQAGVMLFRGENSVVWVGYIPLAFHRGWRRLSEIYQERSLSLQINWMSVKEKERKWNSGEKVTQTFVLVEWWEMGGWGGV